MPCCLLCFSGDIMGPDDDPNNMTRQQHKNNFQKSMQDMMCTPQCLVGMLCGPCCAFTTRKKALDGDLSKYTCCQGYMDGCCCGVPKAGTCGESSCPACCLCLESCCCVGFNVSSTRLFVMDRYELTSDPCDRRMMRFTNALQCFACICEILALFQPEFADLADLLTCIADTVFCMTIGCMIGQLNYELDYQKTTNPNMSFPGKAVSVAELRKEARNGSNKVSPDYSNYTLNNNGGNN